MRNLVLITFLFSLLTSCSSTGNKKEEDADIISLVLKNYELDFRYCLSLSKSDTKYNTEFTLLPSGMVYDVKISGQTASVETPKNVIQCMENIFLKIIFPPVRDKKAVSLKRELLF